jgi:D-threonine aldolase
MNWWKNLNFSAVDTPSLIVNGDLLLSNIQTLKGIVPNLAQLQPHVKTHKSLEVTQLLLAEGISKFKCATIAEAEMLGMAGAKEVLLAFPVNGPKWRRYLALVKKFPNTKYTVIVDNIQAIKPLFSEEIPSKILVYLDINVGMNRTGVSPSNALELFLELKKVPFINIEGIHAYDGHIYDTDLTLRNAKAQDVHRLLVALIKSLENYHEHNLKVVIGGSPTFPIYANLEPTWCVSPGTFVYWDHGYGQLLPDLPFTEAAMVVTRVISVINKHKICLDLGHKAIAAENPMPRVYFPDFPKAIPLEHSEEHLVVQVEDSDSCNVGDIWVGIPIHICPTMALHASFWVYSANNPLEQWEVSARNRVLSI